MVAIHAEMPDAGFRADLAEPVNQAVAGTKDRHQTRIGLRHGLGCHWLKRRFDIHIAHIKRGECRMREKPGQFMQRLAEMMVCRITVAEDRQLVSDKRMVHYDETGSVRGCHVMYRSF